MKKRLISLLLVLVMVFAMIPNALAETVVDEEFDEIVVTGWTCTFVFHEAKMDGGAELWKVDINSETDEDTCVMAVPEPEVDLYKEGYEFVGWVDAYGDVYEVGDEMAFSKDNKVVRLYAAWAEVEEECDHADMERVAVVDPTCEEMGYELWRCVDCDYTEKCNEKAALGHDWVYGGLYYKNSRGDYVFIEEDDYWYGYWYDHCDYDDDCWAWIDGEWIFRPSRWCDDHYYCDHRWDCNCDWDYWHNWKYYGEDLYYRWVCDRDGCYQDYFEDIADWWYDYDYPVFYRDPELNKVDHFAYMEGDGKGNISPEGKITRAEAAMMFYRLMTKATKDEYETTRNSFYDVSSDAWYNKAVSTLANAGIIADSTRYFRPNDYLTRAELAVMAVQFSDEHYWYKSSFSDVSTTYWAADEIALCEELGWFKGYTDGTFRPENTITRSEVMAMVNRMLERAVDEDHMLSGMTQWKDADPNAWYYADVQEATNSHTYNRTNARVSGQSYYYYEDWVRLY